MKLRPAAALPVLALFLTAPAAAQDKESMTELPPACAAKTAEGGGNAMAGHEASGKGMDMPAGSMAEGQTDPRHKALMDSMSGMNDAMDAAMSASDIDVAFVCGMIPHHQGAIAMAKAELAHGDDPWARKLAEQVIAAQEKEIAEMTAWLEKQR